MDWTRVESALARTTQTIATGSPLSVVLENIARAVESEDATIKCSILVLDDARRQLLLGAAPSLPDFYRSALDGMELGPDMGACATAAWRNEPVIVTDIQTDPLTADYREMAAKAQLGSCWSQPVRGKNGEVIGTFAMYHQGVAVPSERELAFLESAAAIASVGIQRQKDADLLAHTAACAQEAAEAEAEIARDLASFYEASLDIMCVHTMDSIVERISHSITDILGYSPEEMIGTSILRLLHPDDVPATIAERGELRQNKVVRGFICRVRHADGDYRHIEWQSRPHRGKVFAVGRDITDRMTMVQEMAAAKHAAEVASQAKSVFLTTMSHEIRTPLHGILGMAQLMETDTLTAAQQARLKIMRRSGEALLTILDDILDLAKIESGRTDLVLETFDLDHVVRNKAAAYAPLAAAKGLGFDFDIGAGARRRFTGDRGRLRRIFYALLSNAVKFTEAGHVRLDVDADAAGRVTIKVRDTGIGITPEYQARMFEAFQQGESSLTRGYGGSGLGLAICHHSATLMGGTISVESHPGEGTTFTVVVPLTIAEADVAAPVETSDLSSADSEPGTRPLKVLVAEDHQVNRLVIRAMLEQLGIDPVIVEDGVQAVAAWAREAWDVILMDIQMPEMDGLTATLRIRQEERERDLPRTPIVAVTANAMSHQIKAYMAAGMDGVVPKPFELSALAKAIEAALDHTEETALEPVRSDAETILAMFASSQG